MHTVPEGYLESFAVNDPARRTSGVWRFERNSGESKILGVGDIEVVKDIYTVFTDEGAPDTGIEEVLCDLEGAFCEARKALSDRARPSKECWSALFRFVSAQLLRTPHVFEQMRKFFDGEETTYKQDSFPRVMLLLIERWFPRLARMSGLIAYNETGLPLLTSDNPAALWKKDDRGGFVYGVDQFDPNLVISCPLSPTLMFVAYQTAESLAAVRKEQYDSPRDDRPSESFSSRVNYGPWPEQEIRRMNRVCVTNSYRHVYANYSNEPLRRFLLNQSFIDPAI